MWTNQSELVRSNSGRWVWLRGLLKAMRSPTIPMQMFVIHLALFREFLSHVPDRRFDFGFFAPLG